MDPLNAKTMTLVFLRLLIKILAEISTVRYII